MYEQIVAWVGAYFQLGDRRRTVALAEMVWGLLRAKAATFADIGRCMEGQAQAASKTARVFNWCRNKRVDPHAVQAHLARVVFESVGVTLAGARVIPLAMDWHAYNNGKQSSLRISVLTGGRALPVLWHEIATKDLSGAQTSIEHALVGRLFELRPSGAKFLVLLDAGFRDYRLFEHIARQDYYLVRSSSSVRVHTAERCWQQAGDLPVGVDQIVDFGWAFWNATHPHKTRITGGRITDQRPVRRGRRRRKPGHYKRSRPGLCVVATNVPNELADSQELLRMYSRRYEIEHGFRDTKNATLGIDMDHTDLSDDGRYSRLMCIVAIAGFISWLVGAEAEARNLHLELTRSRPKDKRRVLSLVRVGRWCLDRLNVSLGALIARHVGAAAKVALRTKGRSWRNPRCSLALLSRAQSEQDVAAPKPACHKRNRKGATPCTRRKRWRLEEALLERVA
jgi:hypothetical protein